MMDAKDVSNDTISISSGGDAPTSPTSTEERRKALLLSFTAEDDKRIRRKIDRRFLGLIGMMYLIKQVDFMNAAAVKVLQVGEDRNILNELKMTANEYNWVQSIYFVRCAL
jgi:hypothetical protein